MTAYKLVKLLMKDSHLRKEYIESLFDLDKIAEEITKEEQK